MKLCLVAVSFRPPTTLTRGRMAHVLLSNANKASVRRTTRAIHAPLSSCRRLATCTSTATTATTSSWTDSTQTTDTCTAASTTTAMPPASNSLQSPNEEESTLQQQLPLTPPWKTLFDLELPEGRCLGLQLVQNSPLSMECIMHTASGLHPKEVDYAMAQPSEYAQETFVLGRLAMRQLLWNVAADCHGGETKDEQQDEEQRDDDGHSHEHHRHHSSSSSSPLFQTRAEQQAQRHAILKDGHGRPTLPKPFLGSISHKRSIVNVTTTGVALLTAVVQQQHDTNNESSPKQCIRMGVGVDIEQSSSRKKRSIAKRVLTREERNDLGKLEGITPEEEVLLRFSLKESLYKAMHPLICQYVGFQEAQVTPHNDGTATVEWNLKSGAHRRFDKTTAHWRRVHDFFLSSASVTTLIDASSSSGNEEHQAAEEDECDIKGGASQ